MACLNCRNSDKWHRDTANYIEGTIGPRAAMDFEQEHPENEDDVDEIVVRHEAGEHYDGPVMDCPPCVREWVSLGGKDEMGILSA